MDTQPKNIEVCCGRKEEQGNDPRTWEIKKLIEKQREEPYHVEERAWCKRKKCEGIHPEKIAGMAAGRKEDSEPKTQEKRESQIKREERTQKLRRTRAAENEESKRQESKERNATRKERARYSKNVAEDQGAYSQPK